MNKWKALTIIAYYFMGLIDGSAALVNTGWFEQLFFSVLSIGWWTVGGSMYWMEWRRARQRTRF